MVVDAPEMIRIESAAIQEPLAVGKGQAFTPSREKNACVNNPLWRFKPCSAPGVAMRFPMDHPDGAILGDGCRADLPCSVRRNPKNWMALPDLDAGRAAPG